MTRYNGGKLSGYNPTKICFDCGQRQCAEAENKKLLAQNTLLVEALEELLRSCPQGLECHDFHHPKKDRHEYDEPCKPFNRYMEAMAKASEALAAVSGSLP